MSLLVDCERPEGHGPQQTVGGLYFVKGDELGHQIV